MTVPEHIVEELNAAGLGGRLIYIPLLRKTVSQQVLQQMIERLQSGKQIDFDHYPSTVSVRTLYRLKQKAIETYKPADGTLTRRGKK